MKNLIISFFIFCLQLSGFSQNKIIQISDNLELIKISANAYMHVSYSYLPSYGRVASNGLVFINNKEAFLFDTSMTDSLTMDLVSFIKDSMKLKISGFVPNHWHDDCIGGLGYLQAQNIESYANQMTIEIAKSKNLPVPHLGFTDSLEIHFGNKPIECYYLGAAHSLDNIVVWIPSEKILFPGCMVKSLDSKNLGNTVDGDLIAYPKTIDALIRKFPTARIVVPGHGQSGGLELLTHTKEIAVARSLEIENRRGQWLNYMDEIARPVISNLASDKLKKSMTITLSNTSDNPELRKEVAYLEAFARTLCGISPWLWLTPAQVRCALTEVIIMTIDNPQTFTRDGWLNIGLHGDHPDLADVYINTGSLYLCTTIFLPLGLPPTDPFWTDADAPWTSKKIWNGMNVPADHSLRE